MMKNKIEKFALYRNIKKEDFVQITDINILNDIYIKYISVLKPTSVSINRVSFVSNPLSYKKKTITLKKFLKKYELIASTDYLLEFQNDYWIDVIDKLKDNYLLNTRKNDEDYFHPKYYLAMELISLLYNLEGCNTGGCAQHILEKNKIYDWDIDAVIDFCESKKAKKLQEKDVCLALCMTLKEMNFKQRAVFFKLWKLGYFSVLNKSLCNKDVIKQYLQNCLKESVNDIVAEFDYGKIYYDKLPERHF